MLPILSKHFEAQISTNFSTMKYWRKRFGRGFDFVVNILAIFGPHFRSHKQVCKLCLISNVCALDGISSGVSLKSGIIRNS